MGGWRVFCISLIEAKWKMERNTQVRGYGLHIKIQESALPQDEERLASYEPLTKMTCELSSLGSPEGSVGKASFCLCNSVQNISHSLRPASTLESSLWRQGHSRENVYSSLD